MEHTTHFHAFFLIWITYLDLPRVDEGDLGWWIPSTITDSRTHNPFLSRTYICVIQPGSNFLSFFLFLSLFLSLSVVCDERAPSHCPQKILFVVPVPQCGLSLFESGLSIRAAQKTLLQCGMGRRNRFKWRKKEEEKEPNRRGER